MNIALFLKAQVLLAILVVLFDVAFALNRRFKFNRIILLGIPTVASAVYWLDPIYLAEESILPVIQLPEFILGAKSTSTLSYFVYVPWAYFIISVFIIGLFAWSTFQHYVKGAQLTSINGRKVRLIQQGGSYSLFNRIFLNQEDLNNELILQHESMHLRLGHSWDLLFANLILALCWINPLAWRWRILIRENHEFQVDHYLIAHSRKSAADYVHLLLDRALSTNQFSLRNYFSLNSLTSKRITMLNKQQKQKAWKTLLGLSLMAGSAFYLAACDKVQAPENANAQVASETLPTEEPVYEKVDEMPQFPGGNQEMFAYMGKNIKYPASAKESGIEGVVYVSFVVNPDGSLDQVSVIKPVESSLDAEAMRAVAAMPHWTPGKKDGKNVKVKMVLPIRFQMAS